MRILSTALIVTLAILSIGANGKQKVAHVQLKNYLPNDEACVIGSTIPAGFVGHNIISITKELTALAKDDYESTKDYESRIASLRKSSAVLNQPLCFIAPEINQIPSVAFTYNGDSAVITIDLAGAFFDAYAVEDSDWNNDAFRNAFVPMIDEAIHHKGHYVAENAFGVEADVSSKASDLYALFVRLDNPTISIPIRPEIAREAKDHLGMVFVVKLIDPYLVKTSHFMKATIDAPYSEYGDTYRLQAQLSEAILYDQRTLQIYGRVAIAQ